MDGLNTQVRQSFKMEEKLHHIISSHISAGHEDDGHNFFAVADEDEFGGFLVVSPEGMSDVGEREYLQHFHRIIC